MSTIATATLARFMTKAGGTGRIMHRTTNSNAMAVLKSPAACGDDSNIHNQRNISHPHGRFCSSVGARVRDVGFLWFGVP